MAQITNITSEALQATVRRLLPSQQGFGEDLQASNVITPVIDLTPTAEGSEVRADLQTALAHGSITTFNLSNSDVDIVSTAGFYRVFGFYVLNRQNVAQAQVDMHITDGSTTKYLFVQKVSSGSDEGELAGSFDFVIFLRPGDTFNIDARNVYSQISGSVRQIADVNGVLVNPAGFTPQ